MTKNHPLPPSATDQPVFVRLIKTSVRYVARAIAVFVIFAAALVLFAQTQLFQQWVREHGLALLNEQLKGKIVVDDMHVDLFHGIDLHNPRLYADGTTVMTANRIVMRYDLSTLFVRVATVTELSLLQPQISLIRSTTGVWNFTQIAAPTDDTTAGEPPAGTLYIRHLRIVQGTLLVDDKGSPWQENNSNFDPGHLSLYDLSLDAMVRLNLADHDLAMAINSLKFKAATGGPLSVDGLTAIARVSPNGVDVQELMVAMPNTQFDARLRMKDVDVLKNFSESMFTKHPLVGRIEVHRLWGPDLTYFVPEVDVLGLYSLQADVEYSGNSLLVNNLELKAGPNNVSGSVHISELYGARPLLLDIAVAQSTADYADIRHRLRFVPLPELPFLHSAVVDTIIVRGTPADSLWIQVNAADRPGRIDGTLSLLLGTPQLGYHLNAKVANGDIGAFVDSSASTSINGQVTMNGSGISLADLKANMSLSLTPSTILGRPIKQMRTSMVADGKSEIRIDTLNVTFSQSPADTSMFPPVGTLESIAVNGTVNLANLQQPTYQLAVRSNNLNISRILRMYGLPTAVSADIEVDMEGIDLDSVRGSIHADVATLDLHDRSMFPFSLDASFAHDEASRQISLRTDFAFVELNGEFSPTKLIDVLHQSVVGIANTSTSVARHFTSERIPQNETVDPIPTMRMHYTVAVSDVSPITMIMPELGLTGSVKAVGNITSGMGSVHLQADTIAVNEVLMNTDSLAITTDEVQLAADLRLAQTDAGIMVDGVTLHVHSHGDVMINESVLSRFSCDIAKSGSVFSFAVLSGLNTMAISAKGSLADHVDAAVLKIDSGEFVLDSVKGLRWAVTQPAAINIARGTANIEMFEVRRPWSETVRLSGFASPTNFTGTTVSVENFPLTDIPKFTYIDASHPVRLLSGLVTKATFTVNGTFKEPIIESLVEATDLSYNNSVIGNLRSKLMHKDQVIQGMATVIEGSGETTKDVLTITVGSLPVNLSFTDVKQRIDSKKPWDIAVEADELNLTVAEPFLPAVERVRGRVNAGLALRGPTLNAIKLSGKATYWNGSFLSSATNINYTSHGSISLDDNILHLDTVAVYNLSRDHRDGYAVASGDVVFDGLTVDSIDFNVITPNNRGILVLNPSSQARSPIVYGDLVIASGSKPIRLYGKLATPNLEGDIEVLYSDIVFPRERSTTKARNSSFEYVHMKDSTPAPNLVDYLVDKGDKTFDDGNQKPTNITEQAEAAVKAVVEASTASFADIIHYDINIFLRGRTLLTMVLSPFEILVADMELVDIYTPLRFTGKFADNSTNLKGSVRLKEGTSTYKFYKPFQTSGTLNFSSGGMMNPDLNLVAIYQNRRMVNDKPEDYKVQLKITGTKQKPRIAYRLWRNDREVVGDSSKIASDALMLILVGKTTDDMLASGQGDLAGQVNAAFSSLATSALSDVISGVGFVQNAQFDLGSDISQSRITLSGQLYGDITYRVSGQISEFSGNNTFTVTVPLTVLGDKEAFRLFQADFSHTINNTGNITRQTRLWEIKIGARLP